MKRFAFVFIFALVLLSACKGKNEVVGITKEAAYEGVSNYCQSVYDWSIAEENPDIMYLKMGEETETEYQVVFRSYTGAFVYFYVDKSSGITRLVEYVPDLEIEEEAGVINLYDYLKS